MPIIITSDNLELRNNLRKLKRNRCLLMTKLTDNILSDLRITLKALLKDLTNQEEVLSVIFDSGCSYMALGFQTFQKGTPKLLQELIELDGIGSWLKATHERIIPYKYINHKKEIQILESMALYIPDLKYRLFSP